MPAAMTHDQVCNFIGIHPSKLHHWIRKGYFRPRDEAPGRGNPRQWSPAEVLRLKLFADIVEHTGTPPDIAGRLAVYSLTANEDEDFLVLWRTYQDAVADFWSAVIPRREIGDWLLGEHKYWRRETGFADQSARAQISFVFDPAPIVRDLRETWETLGYIWDAALPEAGQNAIVASRVRRAVEQKNSGEE